jgi:hypothetical protein
MRMRTRSIANPTIIEQRNGFQRFVVPVYYWKTVEKPDSDPELLWEWQYFILCL